MMETFVHVHGGDHSADVARRAGLPGLVVSWKDSLAVGPSATDDGEHRALRAGYWGVAEGELQDAGALPLSGETVLWFGADPWEQMQLVEVLAARPEHAEHALALVDVSGSVSQLSPAALKPLFASRVPCGDLQPIAREVLTALRSDDREALWRLSDKVASHQRLPYLAPAIQRILDDREHERTARQVRELVAAGVTELPELMARLKAFEAPLHGVWYGDAVVKKLVLDAQASARK